MTEQNRRHGFSNGITLNDFNPRKTSAEKIDENAIRYFARLMLDRMDVHGNMGRAGWQDSCVPDSALEDALKRNLAAGDWINVANYAMMLQIRKELRSITMPAT